jgi:hypothetical protein
MMTDELPIARTALAARYVRVMVFCKSRQHRADADLQALIDSDRGDVPLTQLRFRCAQAPPTPTLWSRRRRAPGA